MKRPVRMRVALNVLMVIAFGSVAATLSADDAPAAKPYKAELERVYGLQKGQVIKRVERPYIPERLEWYRAEQQHQAAAIPRGPDYMVFEWNDATGLKNWSMGFGFEKVPLRTVLEGALRMKSYEYEGPPGLLSLDLAGDWVVRPEVGTEEKLVALVRLVKQATGRDVRFEKRDLPREVIVAGGTWDFKPLQGTFNDKWVHLFSDKQDDDGGSGGGSGDLDEFLKMLGDRTGARVVDEVKGERPKMFTWGHHRSSRLHNLPPGPERTTHLNKLLENVTKQTGLTLEPARRNIPVWVLLEVKPEA